jgi:diaminopimelate epimerase
MRFWKYHGLGNDFVLLDGHDGSLGIDGEWCRRVCDRNFGIGADGVLYIMPGEEGAEITMRIINADGTEAEMCGNGIRCVAKHAFDFGLVNRTQFSIHTLSGNMEATLTVKDARVVSVRINMGAPILDCALIPMNDKGTFVSTPLVAGHVSLTGTAVSMGNPHFVTFDELSEDEVRRLGPILESHCAFPKKTNVEFAQVRDGRMEIKVYERGAGWTLACGTGACAAATAAALSGMIQYNTPVEVRLPGGWLRITVDRELRYVLMEGPAERVFEGNIAV